MIAALLLAGLFFRLGLEQRLREVGLLRAARLHRRSPAPPVHGRGRSRSPVARSASSAHGRGRGLRRPRSLWGLRTLVGGCGRHPRPRPDLRPGRPSRGRLGGRPRGRPRRGGTLRRPAPALSARAPRGRPRDWAPRPAGAAGALVALGPSAARPGVARVRVSAGSFPPPRRSSARGRSCWPSAALLAARSSSARRPRSALAVRSVAGLGLRGALLPPRPQPPLRRPRGRGRVRDRRRGRLPPRGQRPTSPPATGERRLRAPGQVRCSRCTTTSRSAEGRAALGLPATRSTAPCSHRFRARGRGRELPEPLPRPAAHGSRRDPPTSCARAASPSRPRWRRRTEERANPWLLLERASDPRAPSRSSPTATRSPTSFTQAGRRDDRWATRACACASWRPSPRALPRRARHGRAALPEVFPGETGVPLLPLRRPRGARGRGDQGPRVAPLRLRLRRRRDRGSPRGLPPRREHLHRDVPGPGRPRPPPRHRRARDRPPAQRSRAARASSRSCGRSGSRRATSRGWRSSRTAPWSASASWRERCPRSSPSLPRSSIAAGRCRWRSWPSCSSPWPSIGLLVSWLAVGVRAPAAASRLAALRMRRGPPNEREPHAKDCGRRPRPPHAPPPARADWPQWRGPAARRPGDPRPPAPPCRKRSPRPGRSRSGRATRPRSSSGTASTSSAARARRRWCRPSTSPPAADLASVLPRALHDEQRRHRPRQGAEVDTGRRRRARLHLRHRRDPLRLRCRDRPARSGGRTRLASHGQGSPLYGVALSPVVDGGSVIVHVGGPGKGALTAFDAATGAVRWAWKGDGPAYASPVVADDRRRAPGRDLQRVVPRGGLGRPRRAPLEAPLHDPVGAERGHAGRGRRPRRLLRPRPSLPGAPGRAGAPRAGRRSRSGRARTSPPT